MKIKINEAQLSKINRLNESTVNIDKHITDFGKINDRLNKISNKITFISVDELVRGETTLSEYKNLIEALESFNSKTYMDGYQVIDQIPKEEYESMSYDFDSVLDDKKESNDKKIRLLLLLLEHMGGIVNVSQEMLTLFSDNKPMEI